MIDFPVTPKAGVCSEGARLGRLMNASLVGSAFFEQELGAPCSIASMIAYC
jgi:hypothetical protein